MKFYVDLYSLQHGGFAETLTIDAALDRLVPSYYIDREKARKSLRDGQALRTTAYEYRRSEDDANDHVDFTAATANQLRNKL